MIVAKGKKNVETFLSFRIGCAWVGHNSGIRKILARPDFFADTRVLVSVLKRHIAIKNGKRPLFSLKVFCCLSKNKQKRKKKSLNEVRTMCSKMASADKTSKIWKRKCVEAVRGVDRTKYCWWSFWEAPRQISSSSQSKKEDNWSRKY